MGNLELYDYKGMRYGLLNLGKENDLLKVRSAFRDAMALVSREKLQFGILKRTIEIDASTAMRTYESEWMLRELPEQRFHLALVFKQAGKYEHFVESILVNRMHNVQVFTEMPEAVNWLYSIYLETQNA